MVVSWWIARLTVADCWLPVDVRWKICILRFARKQRSEINLMKRFIFLGTILGEPYSRAGSDKEIETNNETDQRQCIIFTKWSMVLWNCSRTHSHSPLIFTSPDKSCVERNLIVSFRAHCVREHLYEFEWNAESLAAFETYFQHFLVWRCLSGGSGGGRRTLVIIVCSVHCDGISLSVLPFGKSSVKIAAAWNNNKIITFKGSYYFTMEYVDHILHIVPRQPQQHFQCKYN